MSERHLAQNELVGIELGKIYQGDCITFMERLTHSRQVNLIIADPPYNIGYCYDIYQDNKSDAEYLDWSERWIRAAANLLAPDGALWIAIGDEYAAEIKWLAQRHLRLHLRNWVIWYYTFGVQCQDKFSRSHTHLLYFVKDPRCYKFRAEAIRVPSARRLVYKDARSHPAGRVPDNTWILRPHDLPWAFLKNEDTWYFPRVAGTFKERAKFMQCQLPEKLLARIILACTDPNDLVFDPFAGSGSSLIVAKKLGRQFLGCELSPNYTCWANQRLSQVQPGDPLEGPEDPLVSAPATVYRNAQTYFTSVERKNLEQGVINCFQRSSRGYSVDRVLADPVLNARFLDACSVANLPGRPLTWNLTLLRLRKAGRLVSGSRRRSHTTLDLDRVLHAAEIATRNMLDQGYPSIDYILCDPAAVVRFDDYARRLAPGHKAWHYRWAALYLRKRAKKIRERARQSAPVHPSSSAEAQLLEPSVVNQAPHTMGLYFLWLSLGAGKGCQLLYIGESTNLAETIQQLVSVRETLASLCRRPGNLMISWQVCELSMSRAERSALRYQLIKATAPKPEWNYLAVRDCKSHS